MGGLAGGRVRSICKRGIPKKKSCSLNTAVPGLTVLNICNSTAGEIGSEKCSPFIQLSNLLFDLITHRSQFSYKSPLFLTIMKIT